MRRKDPSNRRVLPFQQCLERKSRGYIVSYPSTTLDAHVHFDVPATLVSKYATKAAISLHIIHLTICQK